MRKKKNLALAAAVMLLITFLFSYSFLIQNVHHDCIGEECSVCIEVAVVAQTLSSLRASPVLSFSVAVLCVFTLSVAVMQEQDCIKDTLITLKVELLD